MKRIILLLVLPIFFLVVVPSMANASVFYVWTDSTGDGAKDTVLGSINGYTGTISGKNNYDYFSFSGHPVNGANPQPHKLKIFVYERITNGRDFLNIIGGEDAAGHRGHRHAFSLSIDIFGSTLDPHRVQGDEPKEFKETFDDHFEGDWSFRRNTDGGVIGGLKGDWEAKIVLNNSELDKHVFVSKGSNNIAIDDYINTYEYDAYFISRTDQLPQSNVIPEPATMMLFGAGMFGMAARRRRKK